MSPRIIGSCEHFYLQVDKAIKVVKEAALELGFEASTRWFLVVSYQSRSILIVLHEVMLFEDTASYPSICIASKNNFVVGLNILTVDTFILEVINPCVSKIMWSGHVRLYITSDLQICMMDL